MFRSAVNTEMDTAVARATDETLVSENWEYIFNVVDKVAASPTGAASATASLIKRLAHRNANVQLYTLELANALSQNCGNNMHRELASKAFTDALLRLASDRNTHGQVKQKVLERMGSWAEEFGKNPDFGIMEQAYQKLRREQPSLMPPSKPVKTERSEEDRRKEEEELQMALALSIKDKGAAAGSASAGASGQTNGTSRDDSVPQPAQTQAAVQSQHGTTAATVSRVRALYDFTPSEPGELAFRKNDIIAVLESVYKDWWRGSLRGQSGIFPLNYVEKLQDPTKEELERDAQMEAEVFGEIKNVERLLALLSVRGDGGGGRRGEREEEEISELYQRTLSIRPKLIELIGKYSQKKDDFTQLNEKFIKARRDYEALLESSMAQPQYHQQPSYPQQFPIRNRQSSNPMYAPQQQQAPYSAPPQQLPPAGYTAQGPPSAGAYQPQQSYPPQQSQQHLPPQQDVQRFYSPAPSEPPPGPQPGYTSPYPQSNGPPPVQAANGGTAAFHFIPGGLQAPPPSQQQADIRRKPSPQTQPSAAPGQPSAPAPPSAGDPYSAPQPGFDPQLRPNSIHTLNSGNPQELATPGYESPVDNRHSYPPAQFGGYEAYPPQPQQPPPGPPRDDREGLPTRQRTQSFESPGVVYAQHPQQQQGGGWEQPGYAGGPGNPNQAPPPQEYAAYQAYQPQAVQGQRVRSQSSGDPGDFYR